VDALVAKLESSQPHYIRCIKSNDEKKGFGFNEDRVRHQSRYLNLVETVRVRRAGFVHRQEYEHFFRRYLMVCVSLGCAANAPSDRQLHLARVVRRHERRREGDCQGVRH
jgi:myosin-1